MSKPLYESLGQHLSQATTARQVAEALFAAADGLLDWDAGWLNLCSLEQDITTSVLAVDVVAGARTEVPPASSSRQLTPKLRQILVHGPELLLRAPDQLSTLNSQLSTPQFPLTPFGDQSRPSASLMFVPIRCQERSIGVLSLQSYRLNAFTEQDLQTLQALADLGSGALERLQLAARLQRTEELYRRAIAGAGAVPYAYDYRSRSYVFIGPEIEQLTGYPSHEINGDLWTRITQESIMAGDAVGLQKAEASRRTHSGELKYWRCDMRILTREGKVRWLSDASVQNQDEAGQVIGSMGILEDITERKQAEIAALAFSKLGHRLISVTKPLEVAQALVQVADELFGWDACAFHLYWPETDEVLPVLYMDTVAGQRREVTPPPPGTRPSAVDRRVLQQGAELILREAAQRRFDSQAVPYGDAARPSASILRVPLRLRAQVTGIAALHSYTPQAYTQRQLQTFQALADYCGAALERLRADEALRESESQLRLVWESSADGMRLTSPDGIILKVNDAYCRMVHKTRAQLEGRPFQEVYHPAYAQQALKRYLQLMEAHTMATHDTQEVTLWNGQVAWFELSNSRLEGPDHPLLLLSIFRDITARKAAEAELERMHRQLLEVSRQAGMAEVATSVLHNVGNVLNSVNISSSLLADKIRHSKVGNLARAMALMQEHAADLAPFLTQDPKGRQLPGYLSGLAEHLAREQKEFLQELASLGTNVEHIKEIVAMQQSYARVLGVVESLPVVALVEDALRLNAGAIERHRVRVVREFAEVPPILVDKHKVLQILVNLIRNAKYALDDKGHLDKFMTLRIEPGPSGVRSAERGVGNANHLHSELRTPSSELRTPPGPSLTVRISVMDNGIGIPAENLTRIFEHGFTTRKQGHGFGLHNSALVAKELNGSLTVHSEGPGQGACFTLELPCQPAQV